MTHPSPRRNRLPAFPATAVRSARADLAPPVGSASVPAAGQPPAAREPLLHGALLDRPLPPDYYLG